ncbi:unnamed protein product [Euphydryas editha]|uniref:Reverse transcriptase n=1 Tax=Euphydryas editha TaxID=104508 RepID=A0AAU9VA70_EUPED|nr:unnamed protein product [Euphydryas editha]
MRYLGLTLDGRWTFRAHFAQLAPRVVGAAASLGRLLPNVGGPSANCRRLYSGVIRSMAMYGAPVWVDALSRANKTLLRRPQRVIATRAIRGYRTVSWTAACVLAGDPPGNYRRRSSPKYITSWRRGDPGGSPRRWRRSHACEGRRRTPCCGGGRRT